MRWRTRRALRRTRALVAEVIGPRRSAPWRDDLRASGERRPAGGARLDADARPVPRPWHATHASGLGLVARPVGPAIPAISDGHAGCTGAQNDPHDLGRWSARRVGRGVRGTDLRRRLARRERAERIGVDNGRRHRLVEPTEPWNRCASCSRRAVLERPTLCARYRVSLLELGQGHVAIEVRRPLWRAGPRLFDGLPDDLFASFRELRNRRRGLREFSRASLSVPARREGTGPGLEVRMPVRPRRVAVRHPFPGHVHVHLRREDPRRWFAVSWRGPRRNLSGPSPHS